MQLFILTLHCTSRAHCKVCRNLDGGRIWRQKIGKTYELPQAKEDAVDPADFECPYGVTWNSGTPQVTQSEIGSKPVLAALAPQPKMVVRNTGSRGERKGCGCSRSG